MIGRTVDAPMRPLLLERWFAPLLFAACSGGGRADFYEPRGEGGAAAGAAGGGATGTGGSSIGGIGNPGGTTSGSDARGGDSGESGDRGGSGAEGGTTSGGSAGTSSGRGGGAGAGMGGGSGTDAGMGGGAGAGAGADAGSSGNAGAGAGIGGSGAGAGGLAGGGAMAGGTSGSAGASGGSGGLGCNALRAAVTEMERTLQACDPDAADAGQCQETISDPCHCLLPVNEADSSLAETYAGLVVELRSRCDVPCVSQCPTPTAPSCFEVPGLGAYCAL